MTSATTSACPRGAPHRAPHLPWQHPVTSVPLPLPGPKRRHLPRWPRCLAAGDRSVGKGDWHRRLAAEATGTGDWHRRLAHRRLAAQATGTGDWAPGTGASCLCLCPAAFAAVCHSSLAPHSAIGSLSEAWAGACKARLRARGQPQNEGSQGGGGRSKGSCYGVHGLA